MKHVGAVLAALALIALGWFARGWADPPASVQAQVDSGAAAVLEVRVDSAHRAAGDSIARLELAEQARRRRAAQDSAAAAAERAEQLRLAALAKVMAAAKDSAAASELGAAVNAMASAYQEQIRQLAAIAAAAHRRAEILEVRWQRADSSARRYQQVAVDLQRRLEVVAAEVRPSRFWQGVATGALIVGVVAVTAN